MGGYRSEQNCVQCAPEECEETQENLSQQRPEILELGGGGLLLRKAAQSLKIGHFVLPGLGWGLAGRWRNWSEASREFTFESEMR